MKKYFGKYALTWIIYLLIFNAAVFISPVLWNTGEWFTPTFWIAYALITLAFIGHLISAYFAFKAESAEEAFLNSSIIRTSQAGLAATMVIGTAVMAVPYIEDWYGIVACLAIMGFTAIRVINASLAIDAVKDTGVKVSQSTEFMKNLAVESQGLASMTTDAELKEKLRKLAEDIRYSDPVSSEATKELESRLKTVFTSLKKELQNSNETEATRIVEELKTVLSERNEINKSYK